MARPHDASVRFCSARPRCAGDWHAQLIGPYASGLARHLRAGVQVVEGDRSGRQSCGSGFPALSTFGSHNPANRPPSATARRSSNLRLGRDVVSALMGDSYGALQGRHYPSGAAGAASEHPLPCSPR